MIFKLAYSLTFSCLNLVSDGIIGTWFQFFLVYLIFFVTTCRPLFSLDYFEALSANSSVWSGTHHPLSVFDAGIIGVHPAFLCFLVFSSFFPSSLQLLLCVCVCFLSIQSILCSSGWPWAFSYLLSLAFQLLLLDVYTPAPGSKFLLPPSPPFCLETGSGNVLFKLANSLPSSCLSLLGAGIIGRYHSTWLFIYLFVKKTNKPVLFSQSGLQLDTWFKPALNFMFFPFLAPPAPTLLLFSPFFRLFF